MSDLRKKILTLVEEYAKNNFYEKNFIVGESDVPVSGKVIDFLEIGNLVESSLDGWLTTGRYNKIFQDQLAEFLI